MSKYLLVTGASSGIGKGIASSLSKNYNLILHGRDAERLELVKDQCDSSLQHLIWRFDLNDTENLESSLIDFIQLNQIVISHYVHSAGFMKMVPLKMINLELIQNTFNANLFSAILITKVLTQKKVNNAGLESAVFISSNMSNSGAKAMSTYGASKGALDTFMKCLAVELAPKVRINSVLPGAVITEMTKQIFENDEVRNRMEATYPLGIGKPEDIANSVAFLLSEQAKWITGQQFTVDGGRSINITA
jgi:NAD(P)-dependent dehydrogenase (short-subunit alcohol dehydrogenase family)